MRPKAEALGYLEARTTASAEADSRWNDRKKSKCNSTASATTKANTGILHFVQDDGGFEGGGLPTDVRW
jgi:hypothetical protein